MTPSLIKSANDGEEVKVHDGQLFLGAGAEPLSNRQLSWGTTIVTDPVESQSD